MKCLRKTIRYLLAEAMKDPRSLTDQFAIWTTYWDAEDLPGGTELDFVLYDIEKAKQILEQEVKNWNDDYPDEDIDDATEDIVNSAISDSIVAVLRARVPGRYGDCLGAWEVIRSAAEGGYGPTLYDLIMSISPKGLVSDRSSVSSSAKGVWQKYATSRQDVNKEYLDDEGIQVTADEEDDCALYGGRAADGIKSAMKKLFMNWLVNNYQDEYELGKAMDNGEWPELDPDEILDDIYHHMREEDYEDYDEIHEQMVDEWNDFKYENERNLYDEFPLESLEDDYGNSMQLNLAYNTDYAEDAFGDLQSNHSNFVWTHIEKFGLDPELFDQDGDGAQWAVRDFFQPRM